MSQTNQSACAGLDGIIQGVNVPIYKAKEQCINTLDSFLGKYANEDLGEFSKELEVIKNRLSRARREFDSTCFFVLIVGPLKSGKSSFVNILTRAQVSPTDVLECTAIPTIIGKAEGEHRNKIIGYHLNGDPQQQNGATSQDVFNQIIDVLRGIEPQSTLDKMVTKEVKEASKENLNKMVMVNENTHRPLLATIGVDKNGFIDDQIMIIDMPGLDGRIVNDKNPLYQSMVERADFIFFVQSSTSAINEATNDFLKWLLSNKLTQVPIRLIHNHHESLHFIQDEFTEEMVERQIRAGEECIRDMFNVTREFDHYKLNFAKIGYALMAPEKIKTEQIDSITSYVKEYEEWEEGITKKLKDERQKIKDQNCVAKCGGYIGESLAIIDTIKQRILSRQTEIANKKLALNGLPTLIRDRSEKVSFADLNSIIENKLVTLNIGQMLKTHIETKTRDVCESISSKKSGAELKGLIDELAKAYSAIGIFNKYSDIWHSLRQEIHQTIQNTFNDVLENVQTVLNDNIAWVNDIDEELLPTSISAFTPCYFDIEERRSLFSVRIPFTTKYYSANISKDYLNIMYKNECLSTCQRKIDGYVDAVRLAAINIKNKCVESISSQLKNRVSTIIVDLEQELNTLERYQNKLNEMEKILNQ